MYKQSPSRNQRSKGRKVKHALQICLLLAICFWLIYQIKRSHDKKKEFDEHDAKVSLMSTERRDEVLKLGRKDLNPRVEETAVKNGKHDEEVEEEEAIGEEEEQEDNKTEEKDVEESGGGDEEVDDHDQENSDAENDHVEDFVDDEKEREDSDEQESGEKDSDDINGQTENDSSLQDQDHEGSGRNGHEAREENYKADDASSAVTHDTQISSMVNETDLEKSNEHAETILEQQNTSNDTMERNADQNTAVKVEDGETANNGSKVATMTHEVNESTPANSTVTEGSNSQPEVNNNPTEVRGNAHDLAPPNGNGAIPEFTQVHSVIEGNLTLREDSTLQITAPELSDNSTLAINNTQVDSNSTIYTKSEDINSSSGEPLRLSGDTESSISEIKSNVSAKAEDNSTSSETENSGATEDVKDDGTGETNEGLDEVNSETSDEMQHDPIDSSNSSISLEEKDVRTDLETLPQIQTEGSNSEDDAVE